MQGQGENNSRLAPPIIFSNIIHFSTYYIHTTRRHRRASRPRLHLYLYTHLLTHTRQVRWPPHKHKRRKFRTQREPVSPIISKQIFKIHTTRRHRGASRPRLYLHTHNTHTHITHTRQVQRKRKRRTVKTRRENVVDEDRKPTKTESRGQYRRRREDQYLCIDIQP